MKLYHSTSKSNLSSITDKGLQKDEFGLVYLSTYPIKGYDVTFEVEIPNRNLLIDWRDVWMEDGEEIDQDHQYDPDNPYFVYMDSIPPEYLTITTPLQEKYERVATAKSLKQALLVSKQSLQTEEDAEMLLQKLNRIGYAYDVSFSDEEQYGHEWSYGDVGIQLGYISEDGSITIVCDPANIVEYVLFDDNMFALFVRTVTSIVNHELVHRDQLESTPFDHQVTRRDLQNSESNDKYLSNTKEIDAHAAQAVSEFLEMGYTEEEIRSWLTSTEEIEYHAPESNAFWRYWNYYGSQRDEDDVVWKRFLTRFYDFLQQDTY